MAPGPSQYYQAVQVADELLAKRIDGIREAELGGTMTVREAADARIAAMEDHLAGLRKAREEHLS